MDPELGQPGVSFLEVLQTSFESKVSPPRIPMLPPLFHATGGLRLLLFSNIFTIHGIAFGCQETILSNSSYHLLSV